MGWLAATAQLVERRASDGEVAGPWFHYRTGNTLLLFLEKRLMFISHCELEVYLLWWLSLTKNVQNQKNVVLRSS